MSRILLATILALVPDSSFAQETTPAPQQTPVATPTPAPTPAAPFPGSSADTAYKVKNVDQEYAIMRKLGIKVEMQALITGEGGHPYDRLSGTDVRTGEKRDVWFDIKSFFGKEFGL